MTALTYGYQATEYDERTEIALIVYTPSVPTLPTITKQVRISATATVQDMQIAISQKAPFDEWWALDPSTKPVPIPGQWQVIVN